MQGFPPREVVGALMWSANMTQPDIANVVRNSAKLGENPGVRHMKAMEHFLQYTLRTANRGITHGKKGSGIEMLACSQQRPG